MQSLSLVVAGVPALASALEGSGVFKKVYAPNSTGELKDLIAGGILKGSRDELVFVFADTLKVDTPQVPLPLLLQKLTSSNWKVVLVALSPRAMELVNAYPAAGMLEGHISVNMAIGAIAGMGVPGLNPVENGYDLIDLSTDATIKPPVQRSNSGWDAPAPAVPAQDTPARSLRRPEPVSAPAAPTAQPFAAPEPTGGGWATPGATEAPAAPVSAPVRSLRRPEPAMPEPVAPAAPAALGGWDTPSPTAPATSGWATPAPTAPAAPEEWDAPALRAPSAPAAPSGLGGWAPPSGAPVVPDEGPARRLAPRTDEPGGYADAAGLPGGYGESAGPVARGGYGAQHAVPTRRGWSIVVTAPKGGVGKSSLALNLAAYLGLRLRAQGKTVCVIDANFQQADTGKYLNVYNPNITGIVRDQSALSRERIGAYLVHRPDLNISALLGPATQMDASPVYINARLYSQVLEVLRELYDYIIIDTPVAEKYHDIFSGFALPQADYLLVPVAPNVATLMNADGWLRTITAPKHTGGDGVDPAKIGVMLNRAKANIDCSEEEVRQELASWNFIGSIPETDEWQRANNNNELVATKNYSELNEAFARVLHAATGEGVLLENLSAPVVERGGLGSALKSMFRRG